jgi:hypothetical protein
MVRRTQISLEPDQHRRARKRAAELGVSLDEYVRSLINRDLGEPSQPADVSAIIGLGDSGGSDVAREKDRYVRDALESLHPRR